MFAKIKKMHVQWGAPAVFWVGSKTTEEIECSYSILRFRVEYSINVIIELSGLVIQS